MTQEDRVVRSLRRAPRTCKHLEEKLGLVRASAVISNLRRKGWNIYSKPLANDGRTGPQVQYVLYG